MDITPPIEIGMFVRLPGGSHGRVVDRQDGWYVVKLTSGQVVRCAPGRLTPR